MINYKRKKKGKENKWMKKNIMYINIILMMNYYMLDEQMTLLNVLNNI